jgi:hypothetical protein
MCKQNLGVIVQKKIVALFIFVPFVEFCHTCPTSNFMHPHTTAVYLDLGHYLLQPSTCKGAAWSSNDGLVQAFMCGKKMYAATRADKSCPVDMLSSLSARLSAEGCASKHA